VFWVCCPDMSPFRSSLIALAGYLLFCGPLGAWEKLPGRDGLAPGARQGTIQALLLVDLEGTGFAAGASRLSATAVPGTEKGVFAVRFNQRVGNSMASGLREAVRNLALRHEKLPGGTNVEFSFGERESPKDGPSATAACALLLESLVAGKPLRTDFAVTGDMSADGVIGVVGGVRDKVRGAARGKIRVAAVPAGNRVSLLDHVLLGNRRDLIETQVFQIATLAEACEIAFVADVGAVEKSLVAFEKIRPALLANPNAARTNAEVRATLAQIAEATPNHLSARILLFEADGRLPRQLSLAASFEIIANASNELQNAVRSGALERTGTFDEDLLRRCQKALHDRRALLDARTKPLSDGVTELIDVCRDIRDNPVRTNARARSVTDRLNGALARIKTEETKLMNDREVREQLMGGE